MQLTERPTGPLHSKAFPTVVAYLGAIRWRQGEAKIEMAPAVTGSLEGKSKDYTGGQCAQSPDHNPCDLGVFNPLNHHIANEDPKTYDEAKAAAATGFTEMTERKIHDIIRLLHSTIECTIAKEGGNRYKIPHHYDPEFFTDLLD
eukprot:COSAG01_NODE_15693_length_1309_cov_6.608264_1_plen_144_part_10